MIAPVPFPWSVKVKPRGSAPDSVKAGTGYPVAAMGRFTADPARAVVVRILLIAGARVTVRAKACVTVPDVFLAVKVRG